MTNSKNQAIQADEISSLIAKELEGKSWKSDFRSVGRIVEIRDGVIVIVGISAVKYGELLEIEGGYFALALNLESSSVAAVILGSDKGLTNGATVKCTSSVLSVGVGEALLSRVVNALGKPIDGLGEIKTESFGKIEVVAPGVKDRHPVNQPLKTGIKAIDVLTPVGKGQRQLIIGNRQTGKTALAVDAILNQKNENVICIYVAIGQKASTVSNLVEQLQKYDAMNYTIVVSASAAESASLQYLAPYSACAMGEYFRDMGRDVLIIYDDLSKHAVAYRQISLLLRRPPGREAYPGDIFYLHSRLLERSARVTEEYVTKMTGGRVKGKTGSITALPIIETLADDLSAFVPTNVISITDGQIFLDSGLFRSGLRPAVNAGLSTSRVGGAAQVKSIRILGGKIRLILAQYRELEAFSQFASDLDEVTQREILKGQKVTELLKQSVFEPLSVARMIVTLMLIDTGIIEKISLVKLNLFEKVAHEWIDEMVSLRDFLNNNAWSDEIYAQLKDGLLTLVADGAWE